MSLEDDMKKKLQNAEGAMKDARADMSKKADNLENKMYEEKGKVEGRFKQAKHDHNDQ